jgi:hypothetical protein
MARSSDRIGPGSRAPAAPRVPGTEESCLAKKRDRSMRIPTRHRGGDLLNSRLRALLRLSDEARVMLAPLAAYRRLASEPPAPGLATLFRRPALCALVIGCSIALTSTGGATPFAIVTTTASWTFVVGLQLTFAAILIAPCRRPGLRMTSALDLFFAGQGPWLLWMLGVTAAALVAFRLGPHAVPRLRYALMFALVPLIWTWMIIFAFCRAVLGLEWRGALRWTFLYEAAIWSTAYLYIARMTFQAWPFGQSRL